VPVEIRDDNTVLDTVEVDQLHDAGKWNVVGAHEFSGKAQVVVLSEGEHCSTNADAVRFVPAAKCTLPVDSGVAADAGVDTGNSNDATSDDAALPDAGAVDGMPDQQTSDDARSVSNDAGVHDQDALSDDATSRRVPLRTEPMELVGGCSLAPSARPHGLPIAVLLLLALGWIGRPK
jgi:hypothetical protein